MSFNNQTPLSNNPYVGESNYAVQNVRNVFLEIKLSL